MKNKGAFASFLLTLFLIVILVELYSLFPVPSLHKKTTSHVPFREGVIHVHSQYSNGGGSMDDIGQAAQDLGLDFVVVTDHDTLRSKREGGEKTYGNSDLFIESEISTSAGHLLCFLPARETTVPLDAALKDLCWKHYTGSETHPEIFTITAHPNHPRIPWTRLERFAEGTEPINLDVLWRAHWEDSAFSFFFSVVLYPFQNYIGVLRMLSFPEKDRKSWDTMNTLSTGHFGILGSDAHSLVKLNDQLKLRWPSYRETFLMGTNVVFGNDTSADFATRKRLLYEDIRQGKSAMLFRTVGEFPGNDWVIECGKEKGRAGSRLRYQHKECTATIQVPSDHPFGTVIRLYRNGELVAENSDASRPLSLPINRPGTYRVEVWSRARTRLGVFLRDLVPYVFYNPLYVL